VLLLLGCYRSEYAATSPCLRALLQGPPGGAVPNRRELAVGPLTPAEARSLALELLGRDDPGAQAQAEAVAQESGGSPYFVHELVHYVQGGATLTERRPASSKITLDEVLWGRVQQLPEASRRLLEVVAVSGRPLRQADAYQAAQLHAADRLALTVLRANHLVRSTRPGEQDEGEAYHDRIRETVLAHPSPGPLQAHHPHPPLA